MPGFVHCGSGAGPQQFAAAAVVCATHVARARPGPARGRRLGQRGWPAWSRLLLRARGQCGGPGHCREWQPYSAGEVIPASSGGVRPHAGASPLPRIGSRDEPTLRGQHTRGPSVGPCPRPATQPDLRHRVGAVCARPTGRTGSADGLTGAEPRAGVRRPVESRRALKRTRGVVAP
jgi:hypothetical protein